MEFSNGFKLKDSIYDILKWIAIIVLPALSVLYVEKNCVMLSRHFAQKLIVLLFYIKYIKILGHLC